MDAIEQIRSRETAFTSNLFADPAQMQEWIDAGELRSIEGTGAILLFQKDRGFHRVYHVAENPDELSASLASFSTSGVGQDPLISDLVGPPEHICIASNRYARQGFDEYERLVRMARIGAAPCDAPPNSDVATANVDDVPAISQFLEDRLDPRVDRIPTARSLEMAARRGGILVVWRKALPAGVLIFENSNLSAALRYWYVAGEFQDQGIGSGLINGFFRACPGARRIILWVVAGNAESIAKYKHFGFNTDVLEDRIMARNITPGNHRAGNH
jgi:GNAT superfamily N-acetyltransferase